MRKSDQLTNSMHCYVLQSRSCMSWFMYSIHSLVVTDEPRYAIDEEQPELGWTYEKWLQGTIYLPLEMLREVERSIDRDNITRRSHHSGSDVSKCFDTIVLLRSLEGYLERKKRHGSFELSFDCPRREVCLTAHMIQAWFLQSTWDRIKKEGHTFLIREAEQTILWYRGTHTGEAKRQDWSGFDRVSLVREGEVQTTLILDSGTKGVSGTTSEQRGCMIIQNKGRYFTISNKPRELRKVLKELAAN